MPVRHRRAGEHASERWKNGRGATATIASADGWVLTLDTIESTGPLSESPASDRTLCLVRGAELSLDVGGAEHLVERYNTLTLPGDTPTVANADDGTRQCLTLTVRRGAGIGRLAIESVANGETVHANTTTDAIVLIEGALTITTPTSGFPGTPERGRAGRFDALIFERDDRRLAASTVTASVDSIVAFACVSPSPIEVDNAGPTLRALAETAQRFCTN